MIASPGQQRHTSIAVAGQRVVFTTQTKLGPARIGGEQGRGVAHGAGEHAELISEDGARGEAYTLQCGGSCRA